VLEREGEVPIYTEERRRANGEKSHREREEEQGRERKRETVSRRYTTS